MPKPRPLPPLDYLRECFDLDVETGCLFWRVRPARHFRSTSFRSSQSTANNWNTIWAGQEALSSLERGYKWGGLNGRKLYSHRVIWKMVHGENPDVIDHVDGDRSNNRPSNLRNVSQSENCKNQRISIRNKSGVVGVFWDHGCNRWRVTTPGIAGGHLGYFSDLTAASAARKAAEQDAGYHPNHGRSAS